MSSNLAPICLFVYNRYEHTVRTVEALKKTHLHQSLNFIYLVMRPKIQNL